LGKTGEIYEPPEVKVSSKLNKKEQLEKKEWKQRQDMLDNPEQYP